MPDTPKPKRPGPGAPPKDASGEPAAAFLMLRITKKRKAAYVRAARAQHGPGKKLTDWCTDHLDAAANYKPEAPEV